MAVAVRSGTADGTSGGGAVTWGFHAGAKSVPLTTHATGDLILIALNTATVSSLTPSASGWTLLGSTSVSGGLQTHVLYKIAASASETCTLNPGSEDVAQANVLVLSGVDTTTPIAAGEFAKSQAATTSAAYAHPSASATVAGSAVVLFRGIILASTVGNRDFTFSPAVDQSWNYGGYSNWIDMSLAVKTSVSGAQSFTSTASGTTDGANHAWTIIVRPTASTPVTLSGTVASTTTVASATLITNHTKILQGTISNQSTVADASLTVHGNHLLTGTVASQSATPVTALTVDQPPPFADYEFFIDWNRDNGLRVSDFETNFDGWQPESILSFSDDHAYSGSKSLLATWDAGTPSSNPANSFVFNDAAHGFDTGVFGITSDDPADDPVTAVTYSFSGLVAGASYTFSFWAFVPQANGQHVYAEVVGVATSHSPTQLIEQWQKVKLDFVATDTTHTLSITADGTVTTGNKTYIDYVFLTQQFEDVTEQVRSQSAVSWSYGRDQSRALNPISPAETSFTLDNQDGRYSPNNASSPVIDYLSPNREVLIRATFRGHSYDLFRGYLDDIDVDPSIDNQSATFAAVDPLASVGGTQISTQVYQGVRTGDAINLVLDAIDWPTNRRDIDPGATVIDYFWVDGKDASTAIQELVASEGSPAWAAVADSGYFTFRDRHHRIVRPEATTVQTTFSASGTEPCFSPPAEINVGWKDIINSVTLTVQQKLTTEFENDGTGEAPVIWSTDATISLPAGTSQQFQVTSDTPFLFAQVPNIKKGDYIVAGGDVQFSLDRTSGQSATLTVTALSTDIAVTGMKVRGFPITTADGVAVSVVNDDSVASVGQKADTENIDAPWANANDALAIGEIITQQRGERLPTMTITVKNGTADRMLQMLERRISDLIHISEPRSYTDHDFYIETISHSISEAGKYHEVTFGCEAVPGDMTIADPQTNPAFTFNDPQRGFDSGAFAFDAQVATSGNVFILDQSLLDEDGLGY